MGNENVIGQVALGIGIDTTELKKTVGGLPDLFSGLGAKITIAAGFAVLTAAIIKSVESFSIMEDKMAYIKTLGVDDIGLGKLKDELIAISLEVPIAASELAAAAYQGMSAGLSLETIAEAAKVAAMAAKAGMSNTTVAMDAMTTVINVWGESVGSATDVMDVFLEAQNLGKTTLGEMAASIGTVAATAASMGVSFKDLAGATAYLTLNGINTSSAMNGLKAAFANISKPSADAVIMADKLGVNFSIAGIQSLGLSGFIQDLGLKLQAYQAAGGNATQATADLFGSTEALNIMFKLTSEDGLQKYIDMNTKVAESAGNLKEMGDAVNETFSSQMTLVSNNFFAGLEKIGGIIATAITPHMGELCSAISLLFEAVTPLVPVLTDLFVLIATFALNDIARIITDFNNFAAAIKDWWNFYSIGTGFKSPFYDMAIENAKLLKQQQDANAELLKEQQDTLEKKIALQTDWYAQNIIYQQAYLDKEYLATQAANITNVYEDSHAYAAAIERQLIYQENRHNYDQLSAEALSLQDKNNKLAEAQLAKDSQAAYLKQAQVFIDAQKKLFGDLYDWLNTKNINWSMMDSGDYQDLLTSIEKQKAILEKSLILNPSIATEKAIQELEDFVLRVKSEFVLNDSELVLTPRIVPLDFDTLSEAVLIPFQDISQQMTFTLSEQFNLVIMSIGDKFGNVASDGRKTIEDEFKSLFSGNGFSFKNVLNTLKSSLFDQLAGMATNALVGKDGQGGLMGSITGALGISGPAGMAIIGGITALWSIFGSQPKEKNLFNVIGEEIQQSFSKAMVDFWEEFRDQAVKTLSEIGSDKTNLVKDSFQGLFDSLKQGFDGSFNMEDFQKAISNGVNGVSEWAAVQVWFQGGIAWNDLDDNIKKLINAYFDNYNIGIEDQITNFVSQWQSQLQEMQKQGLITQEQYDTAMRLIQNYAKDVSTEILPLFAEMQRKIQLDPQNAEKYWREFQIASGWAFQQLGEQFGSYQDIIDALSTQAATALSTQAATALSTALTRDQAVAAGADMAAGIQQGIDMSPDLTFVLRPTRDQAVTAGADMAAGIQQGIDMSPDLIFVPRPTSESEFSLSSDGGVIPNQFEIDQQDISNIQSAISAIQTEYDGYYDHIANQISIQESMLENKIQLEIDGIQEVIDALNNRYQHELQLMQTNSNEAQSGLTGLINLYGSLSDDIAANNAAVEAYNIEQMETLRSVNDANESIIAYKIKQSNLDDAAKNALELQLSNILLITDEQDRQNALMQLANQMQLAGVDISLQDYQLMLAQTGLTQGEIEALATKSVLAKDALADMQQDLDIQRQRLLDAGLPTLEVERQIAMLKQEHLAAIAAELGISLNQLEIIDTQLIRTEQQKKAALELSQQSLNRLSLELSAMATNGATQEQINAARIAGLQAISGNLGIEQSTLAGLLTQQQALQSAESAKLEYQNAQLAALQGISTATQNMKDAIDALTLTLANMAITLGDIANTPLSDPFISALGPAQSLYDLVHAAKEDAAGITIPGLSGADVPGFADGLPFVPYNDMIARLHYGERVLTATENQQYTQYQTPIYVNITGNNIDSNMDLEYIANVVSTRIAQNIKTGILI